MDLGYIRDSFLEKNIFRFLGIHYYYKPVILVFLQISLYLLGVLELKDGSKVSSEAGQETKALEHKTKDSRTGNPKFQKAVNNAERVHESLKTVVPTSDVEIVVNIDEEVEKNPVEDAEKKPMEEDEKKPVEDYEQKSAGDDMTEDEISGEDDEEVGNSTHDYLHVKRPVYQN